MTSVGQKIDGLIVVSDVCLIDCLQLVNLTGEKSCHYFVCNYGYFVLYPLERDMETLLPCVRFYKCLQHDLS